MHAHNMEIRTASTTRKLHRDQVLRERDSLTVRLTIRYIMYSFLIIVVITKTNNPTQKNVQTRIGTE